MKLFSLFSRKIKPGSIVEILNLTPYQINNIRCEEYRRELVTKSIIGMRFRVDWVSDIDEVFVCGWPFGAQYRDGSLESPLFTKDQIKLI